MPYAKSSATRRRLISSTVQSLRANGYAGTGLSDVIRESGVPRGSLYHHFPGGKAELAASAIHHGGADMVARLRRLHERTGSVARSIEAFCDHYRESLEATGFVAGCPIATVALEGPSLDPTVRAQTGSEFGGLIGLLADALVDDGVAPTRATHLASVIVATIEGGMLLSKATGDTSHLTAARDWLVASIEAELT